MLFAFLKRYAFLLLGIAGIAWLAFVLGAAAERYQFASRLVDNGFTAGEAMLERFHYLEANNIAQPDNVLRKWTNEDNAAKVDYSVKHSKVTWNEPLAQKGYTLLTFHFSTVAYLVDMEGKIVHSWSLPFRTAFPNPFHVNRLVPEHWINFEKAEVFPNGDLLAIYNGWGDSPYGYGMVKMDRNSHVIWTYAANTHHDFYIDKHTGNIYALIQQYISAPISGLEDLSYPLLADSVVILSPEGKELDRIPLFEAFRDSPYALTLYQRPKNTLMWDRLHTNTVMKLEPELADKFPLFRPGQILISMRNLNTIAVLDPVTRKIVWAHTGIWRGQHAASFLDNGHILLFDNKGAMAKGKFYTRVLEFKPDTLEITWSYSDRDHSFYSPVYGRAQRLDNGNTLVSEPMNWRVFEVTPDGKIAWNYQLPKLYKHQPILNRIENKKLCINPGVDDETEAPDMDRDGVPIDSVRYRPEDLPFLTSSLGAVQ